MTAPRPRFTVFTATFNRARTLPRVYESLSRQTLRDFEWLVVDDGSTDGTEELVASWRRRAGFPMVYLRQPNRGKHAAHNAALGRASGELFLPLDSDDECVPRALERLEHHWLSIPAVERDDFSMVSVLCADASGRLVGDPFPPGLRDCTYLELQYLYKVGGEKWSFQRTELLRRHPFPDVPRAPFVPESLVTDAIARRYKTRVANEPLRIYHLDAAPGTDSLVHRPARLSAPGKLVYDRHALNDNWDWAAWAPARFARYAVQYARFSLHEGHGPRAQWAGLRHAAARLLWLACLPAGAAAYALDRLRERR